jgi:hypothetical protein
MDFSVLVPSSSPFLDRRLWGLWLLGLSTGQSEGMLADKAPPGLPLAAIQTQYRTFEALEPFLHRPRTLHSQLLLPLPLGTRSALIQTYYSFDERVVREILGRKLTSRARKELEDIVSKTRIPIGGCRRMFDNLKRVSKRLEDSAVAGGDMVQTILHDFLLSQELAECVYLASEHTGQSSCNPEGNKAICECPLYQSLQIRHDKETDCLPEILRLRLHGIRLY